MVKPNSVKTSLAMGAFVLALVTANSAAQPIQYGQTEGAQSPVILNSGTQGNVQIQYGGFYKERIGKKLAIRRLYLLPNERFLGRSCEPNQSRCKDRNDLYEVAYINLELQSIWPEPFLLTASRAEVVNATKQIKSGAGMMGGCVLAEQITKNWKPEKLLFKPGEVKSFTLESGFKLSGILDFFEGDVLNDALIEETVPTGIYYVGRVPEFNRFLRKRFGAKAAFRIRLFEKDYQPVLTTVVYLGRGVDLFAQGDVNNSKYQLQHDAFIGEVLYKLRGGKEPFDYRNRQTNRDRSAQCGEE